MGEEKRVAYIGNADLDSISAKILVQHFGLPCDKHFIVEYDIFEHQEELDKLLEYDELMFVDFSPDENFADQLLDHPEIHWKVFDHHESHKFLLDLPPSDQYEIHIDMDEVGTSLFFREFIIPRFKDIKPIVYRFVELVKGYDGWQIDTPIWEEALSLNRLCYKQYNFNASDAESSFDLFVYKQTRKLRIADEWFWTKMEKELIDQARQREEDVLSESRKKLQIRKDSRGSMFGLFSAKSKISLTCHALLRENPELDYIICINTWGGITGKLSFRSRDFNLHQLCFAAGHTVASGGQLEPDEAIRLLEGEYIAIQYREDVPEDVIGRQCFYGGKPNRKKVSNV